MLLMPLVAIYVFFANSAGDKQPTDLPVNIHQPLEISFGWILNHDVCCLYKLLTALTHVQVFPNTTGY
ncbi:hypothetical protein [Nostoc sp. PA-18-2419]|uniref:hypothetical protein n=1 Tax=Nostoc sp. PA-18-2419 TaxID=2575443 RepID=UPI001675019A|nr:hypothetical protein [Nostoc sp. PA-18-2419]